MKLERVQVGFEIKPNENGIPVMHPIFKDVLVQSLFDICVKSFKFWMYIVAIIVLIISAILSDNKLSIIVHSVAFTLTAQSLNGFISYLNQLRYEIAVKG